STDIRDHNFLSEILYECDYIQSDDEDCIVGELRRDDYLSTDILTPDAMCNIFMNHPHYNTTNPDYRDNQLLDYVLKYGKTQINLENDYNHIYRCFMNTTFKIPIKTVDIPIISPDKITINAAADTGSDIDAIGLQSILYYRNLNKLKRDRRGIDVSTGNGQVVVHQYLPVTLVTADGKVKHCKFWCLESLPFDWLVGNTTLHHLGYRLTNTFHEYKHPQSNLDYIEEDLDPISCANYPL
ncbi:MAG: hypothetical protein GY938_07715, partial [Ketobacter sp.]|nr:hypothetical protein [Ketobacter sp.]